MISKFIRHNECQIMIRSMTAYARSEDPCKAGLLTWELRSVNHRYLEASFRLPENFRAFEGKLRGIARTKLHRGKFEAHLTYQPGPGAGAQIKVNEALLNEIHLATQRIEQCISGVASPTTMEILRWPGMVAVEGADLGDLEEEILSSFTRCLDCFYQVREREGAALEGFIVERLQQMSEKVRSVTELLPGVLVQQRQRLFDRFEEAKIELDPDRLEQEMLLLAQKIDVAEELDRFDTHIKEFKRILQTSGAVGRRLDFLLQEMNREGNTLGSKSIDVTVSHLAVDIKVLIEQIREQTQNIE